MAYNINSELNKAMPPRKTVHIMDGQPQRVFRKTVHLLHLSDVEDPDLYLAEPLLEWERSEKGQWVMEHAIESPMYLQQMNIATYGYSYAIVADLWEKDATYYALKWE